MIILLCAEKWTCMKFSGDYNDFAKKNYDFDKCCIMGNLS